MSAIDPASMALSYDAPTKTATITFPGLPNARLADASNYRATLLGAQISDAAGNQLDGNGDGVMGGNFAFDFFHLVGDANHDRSVDTIDFNTLAANFAQSGRTFIEGDFNYDGSVDTIDFNLLAANFSKMVDSSRAPIMSIPAPRVPFSDKRANPFDQTPSDPITGILKDTPT